MDGSLEELLLGCFCKPALVVRFDVIPARFELVPEVPEELPRHMLVKCAEILLTKFGKVAIIAENDNFRCFMSVAFICCSSPFQARLSCHSCRR